MSADNRTVQTDALQTLGTLNLDITAGRDAIHLAVEPVIAGRDLGVGVDIGIEKDGTASDRPDIKKLGIVDPFLSRAVRKGEKFWLIVYPRQITSLRHVWSHPDFPEAVEDVNNKEEVKEMNFHERWIRNFASLIGIEYNDLLEGAEDYAKNGNYTYMGDNETYSDHYDKMEEFWIHFTALTGISSNDHGNGGFFSCSC